MKLFYGKKGCGKTTELINQAKDYNGYIVCFGESAARNIFDKAKELKLNINYPLTYQEFVNNKYYAKGVRKVHIDNIECFVRYVSGIEIESCTITIDDYCILLEN